LIFKKALPTKLRALWFAASIISSIWFLYWICYEVLVWNKALTQAAPANYVGLIVSIVLAIISTQLGKRGISEELTIPPEQNVYKEETESQQAPEWERIQPKEETESQEVLEWERVQPSEQVQQIQPPKEEEETTQIPPGASVPPGCKFYLGYLNDRPESVEIPEECLACENVVECLSPTANTINAHAHETA
jgi:hypothetical protein